LYAGFGRNAKKIKKIEGLMTKREGSIVSAYTGILACDFVDFQKYVEEIMGRPVFTHEMGNKDIAEMIKEKSKVDFISLAKSCI
jgi:hypothetical protein